MRLDRRDTPVSHASDDALEAYETALHQLQAYRGDPMATIDAALAQHPDFLLGHLFKAGALMTAAENRFTTMARQSLADAAKLKGNDREERLRGAIDLLVQGHYHRGGHALDELLADYPRDAFALQLGHLFDFVRGNALSLRDRVARVLPHWTPGVPGYGYVKGMHAFGLEECNQYEQAERAARVALSFDPRDGWAAHAIAHCMEMQGRIDDGIAWMETSSRDWAVTGILAIHNWWHLALFHLDRGNLERVLKLYDSVIFGQPSDMLLVLVDATSMLWRLHVLGHDIGTRMEALADIWQARMKEERGFWVFNDVHAMMAFAATGREDQAQQVMRSLDAAAKGETTNAEMIREVGMPVAKGLLAFGRQDWAGAISNIGPVREISNRFGGSHAQRDVLSLTLIKAAINGGKSNLARHVLAERTFNKPESALGWTLLAATA
ncbi:MAG: tetratricopeptide repeat protein [Planctomycetes bacterium]|nr:tetratricopeptide repeat protein [Planctomycetota bacterium]